jgi:hypothetical protein
MPKNVTFEGRVYTFPDDATDDEIIAALESMAPPPAGPTLRAPAAQATAPIDALPSGAAAVAAGAAALTFGWLTARRTLLAARPRLTRRWLGVLGPVVWRCGRCSTEVALGADRCGVCGQYQTWPNWTRAPHQ